MLLRLVVALGGLTFVVTGLGVLFSDSCSSVTWGSRGASRAGTFSATCHDAVVDGAMSQGTAGIIAVIAGVLLILSVSIPLIRGRVADLVNQ